MGVQIIIDSRGKVPVMYMQIDHRAQNEVNQASLQLDWLAHLDCFNDCHDQK